MTPRCITFICSSLTLRLIFAGRHGTIYGDRKNRLPRYDAFLGRRHFGINFALGVATGLTMEFQFGT